MHSAWGFNPKVFGEIPSLKLTFSHLKMDGWKINFLLGAGLFSGAFAVSFREGTSGIQKIHGLEDDFPFQRGDFRVPCWFSKE